MSDTALVVMARYPEAGKTKTRLARSLGNEETAQLYQAFLTDIAHRFAGQTCDLHWTYTPANVDYDSFVATLAPQQVEAMTCFPQQGVDLGERLLYAFQWSQQRGFSRTIVIGSDSPHITRKIIDEARAALDHADVVLGPAEDGGYYLIAMKYPHDVFTGIPMSTDVVTKMTIELAERQGLRIHLLEPLFDVDELSDLVRLAQLLEVEPALAPTTAHHLTSIRSLHDHHTNHTSSDTPSLDLH